MTITVYPARQIHTMDPSLPTATAMAVRGDRIIEVGTMESLRPWLDAHEHLSFFTSHSFRVSSCMAFAIPSS